MSWSDSVHPHGEITELVPGFWQVNGSLPRMGLTRNMTVWRVPEGLAIHSCVCLDHVSLHSQVAVLRTKDKTRTSRTRCRNPFVS